MHGKLVFLVLFIIIVIGAAVSLFYLYGKYKVSSNLPSTYTTAQVSAHNDAANCWSTVNGRVYDLTSWIKKHPGGPDKILSICGSDGSFAFNTQHSGQEDPQEELQDFYIGNLIQ